MSNVVVNHIKLLGVGIALALTQSIEPISPSCEISISTKIIDKYKLNHEYFFLIEVCNFGSDTIFMGLPNKKIILSKINSIDYDTYKYYIEDEWFEKVEFKSPLGTSKNDGSIEDYLWSHQKYRYILPNDKYLFLISIYGQSPPKYIHFDLIFNFGCQEKVFTELKYYYYNRFQRVMHCFIES